MIEFKAWPKIPRLFRDITITEKIDGTNAAIHVQVDEGLNAQDFNPGRYRTVGADGTAYIVAAQSRNRLITPEADNYGFASWVRANLQDLVDLLGPGVHYGEWWGRGIQRGYGLDHRRFTLFDVRRETDFFARESEWDALHLDVVPVLYRGIFDTDTVAEILSDLLDTGSVAAPGYDRPEGVVVRHEVSGRTFKVLAENDNLPKGTPSDD